MYSDQVGAWHARPRAIARGVTIAYCAVAALPLGLLLVAAAYWLMSFRPMNLGFVLGALLCALIGPALVLLLLPAIQAVSNERLVVDVYDVYLVNAQRVRVRSISRDAISGVWSAQLPVRRSIGQRPAYIVTGMSGERPILLTREYSEKDLSALWELLGQPPADVGSVTVAELEDRFPGARYTVKDMLVDLGHWAGVYLVVEAVLMIYIVFTAIRLAL